MGRTDCHLQIVRRTDPATAEENADQRGMALLKDVLEAESHEEVLEAMGHYLAFIDPPLSPVTGSKGGRNGIT